MIKKAIITAAGKGTRQYPATNAVQKELFPLVDQNGIAKPTIQFIVEEALAAGVEEIAIIVHAGEEQQFQSHFQPLSNQERAGFQNKPWGLEISAQLASMQRRITFIHQREQSGFGHAVYCAKEWAAGEPVMLMLGDHVYLSHSSSSCAAQIADAFTNYKKSIMGVQQTPVDQLYLFGTLSGIPADDASHYNINKIAEKPSPEFARQHLITPGLPEDTFLTIFGMYILTPILFDILDDHVKNDKRAHGEIQLTTALADLIENEGAVALLMDGIRLDMGTPRGYLMTQLALAAHGPFAEDVRKALLNSDFSR